MAMNLWTEEHPVHDVHHEAPNQVSFSKRSALYPDVATEIFQGAEATFDKTQWTGMFGSAWNPGE